MAGESARTPEPDEITRDRWRREVGRARVQAALDHLQQAQVEIDLARMDLCAVIGYAGTSDQLGTIYQTIRRAWYKLQAGFERGPTKRYPQINELDHTPTTAERDDPHAGGCGRRGWTNSFFAERNGGPR